MSPEQLQALLAWAYDLGQRSVLRARVTHKCDARNRKPSAEEISRRLGLRPFK